MGWGDRFRREFARIAVRPYVWRELPAWGALYRTFVGAGARDAFWSGLPRRRVRGKLHGYEVEVDLGRWSERSFYFLGRYYDLPTQLLLARVLRAGDRFCDVGANLGMISLVASRLVGEDGQVDAFEPNPECCERFERTIRDNAIRNIRLHRMGLSDARGVLELAIPDTDSVEATFARSQYPDARVTLVAVPVERGDDILGTGAPPRLVKIDVEGFECRVIDGLRETLAAHRPALVTEVVASHLERADASPGDLFERMRALGYEGRTLHTVRSGLRHRLELRPLVPDGIRSDVLWTHPANDPLA